MAFEFEATTFVAPGYELAPGEWSDIDRRAIAALRTLYPEISHWGDLAIGSAFGDFSQYVLEVIWADWMQADRHSVFLDYCCWRQTRGSWEGGLDEEGLAKADNWRPCDDAAGGASGPTT